MEDCGGDVGGVGSRLGSSKGKAVAGSGEVDFKTKAGTAWSHSYLNQKPWHPLSYPNQRRKWIAEQTQAQRACRQEEVAREFAQEQEAFRQTALLSNKEKEKIEMMKAVSFMYVRPPGYNAESAKAAEVADEQKTNATREPSNASAPTPEPVPVPDNKKKSRPKDVFGRHLPTEEEFEVLKNAPRLETGVPVRIKPFGVEVRNVRCMRCGSYGHQSGDRECPLKDAIMPNDESRLKRDDPLTAIMAQTNSSESLKWELKQIPGMSPPRGGFNPDDPNQQIVAEDIFDEYGGFLSGGGIPDLLHNFPEDKPKKHLTKKSKHKHKHHRLPESGRKSKLQHDQSSTGCEGDKERRSKHQSKKKKQQRSDSSASDSSQSAVLRHRRHHRSLLRDDTRRSVSLSSDSEVGKERGKHKHKHRKKKHNSSHSSGSESSDSARHGHRRRRKRHHRDAYYSSSESD